VVQYLRWGYLPGGQSLLGETRQLFAGATCAYPGNDHGSYFDAGRPAGTKEPEDDLADVSSTRSLVETAVRRQLVADVPLGCFLSGGIDSSTIAAAMRRIVPRDQPVHTFSI